MGLIRAKYAGTQETARSVEVKDYVLVRGLLVSKGREHHAVRSLAPRSASSLDVEEIAEVEVKFEGRYGKSRVWVDHESIVCLTDPPLPPEPSADVLLQGSRQGLVKLFAKDDRGYWIRIGSGSDGLTWEQLHRSYHPLRVFKSDEVIQ